MHQPDPDGRVKKLHATSLSYSATNVGALYVISEKTQIARWGALPQFEQK